MHMYIYVYVYVYSVNITRIYICYIEEKDRHVKK